MAGTAETVRRPGARVRHWAATTREDRLATAAQAEAQAAQARAEQRRQPPIYDPVRHIRDSHKDIPDPAQRALAIQVDLEILTIQLNNLFHLSQGQHRADYAEYIGYPTLTNHNAIGRNHSKATTALKENSHDLRTDHGIDVRDTPAHKLIEINDKEIKAATKVPSRAALRTYIETGQMPAEFIKENIAEVARSVGDAARFVTRNTIRSAEAAAATTRVASDAADRALTKLSGMTPEQLIAAAQARRDAAEATLEPGVVERIMEKIERNEPITDQDREDLESEIRHRGAENTRIYGPELDREVVARINEKVERGERLTEQELDDLDYETHRREAQERQRLSPDDEAELLHTDGNRTAQQSLDEIDRLDPDEIDETYARVIEGLTPAEREEVERERIEAARREAEELEELRQEAAEDLARQQREIAARRDTGEQIDQPADQTPAKEEPDQEPQIQRREARTPRPGSYADRHQQARRAEGPVRDTTVQGGERDENRSAADQQAPAPEQSEAEPERTRPEQTGGRQEPRSRESFGREADRPIPDVTERQQPEPDKDQSERRSDPEPDK